MEQDPISEYCRQVTLMIRSGSACKAVSAELTAHMEDHAEALTKRGLPAEEARLLAVEAMGDPRALGRSLDKIHDPWYPRLYRLFCVLSLLLVLAGLYLGADTGAYGHYAPWASPAVLAQRTEGYQLEEDSLLATGKAEGGGRLGAYTFSRTAHAALFRTDAGLTGAPLEAPRYQVRLVFTSFTPCFWLGPMRFSATSSSGRVDPGGTALERPYPSAAYVQGLFRHFYVLTFDVPADVLDGAQISLSFGADHQLTYFLALDEVDTP